MLKIALLALENCIPSTVIGSLDILSFANVYEDNNRFQETPFIQPTLITVTPQSVSGFNGYKLSGTPISSIRDTFDVTIIPAMFGDFEKNLENVELLRWLINQHKAGCCMCSVCAGSFVLAQAGLLEKRAATTHWALADDFRLHYPQVILKPEKMLIDEGDVITAGGVTAYQDLCLHILRRFVSSELSSLLSKGLLIDSNRISQTPYTRYSLPKKHGDKEILKAQEKMEKLYRTPLKIKELTNDMGISSRTFSRRFKQATGDTPVEYLQTIRIEAARNLLENSTIETESIGFEVGYEDSSSFRRLFKKRTGLSPSAYRKRFSTVQ